MSDIWSASQGASVAPQRPPPLSKLVYRSRAVSSLTPPQLRQLTKAAQARNRTESVTGLVLYADDCFFQWLEGPKGGLDRIMRSICNDPRHTEIDVLREDSAEDRRFGAWDLKLAMSGARHAPDPDAIEAPPAIVERLREQPSSAPLLLEHLLPSPPRPAAEKPEGSGSTLQHHAAIVLKAVILQTVVPELVRRHGLGPALSPRVAELADLLIAADQSAAFDLIDELHATSGGLLPLFATLFEPAARALGDLWGEDFCSEFDVALGLGRLQTAARRLGGLPLHRTLPLRGAPAVLIAPEPGELHGLGAALDSEALSGAGWSPQCEYPVDDKALGEILAGAWFDVLDLSLSAAFRREHWLPRLAATIAGARRASHNGDLKVIVGGRIFSERATASAEVGADGASATSSRVKQSILQGMLRRRDSVQ